MTGKPIHLTRRHFSQLLAATTASTLLERLAFPSSPQGPNGFAYIASGADGGAIHTFRVSGSNWKQVQSVASASPAHLEAHPSLPVLYAVHSVNYWDHSPRGAVTAYSIGVHGHLTVLNTQPLSLSATNPCFAAVVKNRRSLFVASEQAGIFNVLSIEDDGSLTPPYAIRKQLRRASPAHILAWPDGTILTADPGQGTISTFTLTDDTIELIRRQSPHPDFRAHRLAHHPLSNCFYSRDVENGSITVHTLEGAQADRPPQQDPLSQLGAATMTMHPEGRFLLVSSEATLAVLEIDKNGRLAPRSLHKLPGPLNLLEVLPGGSSLLATQYSGRILQIPFNSHTGACGNSKTVALVETPASLSFRCA